LKTEGANVGTKLIVGHDTRFMGEAFADVAADIAARRGFHVLKCSHPVPTPTMSHAIRSLKAAGALNFTASHNPPEYQGIKFSTADGAPALPEVTKKIEERIEAVSGQRSVVSEETRPGDGQAEKGSQADSGDAKGSIEELDPRDAYLEDLKTKIRFDVIAGAKGTYGYDPLWGTGRGYLNKVLQDAGLDVETIHDWRDVTFGGQAPEPGEEHIGELKQLVIDKKYTLGLATDGDADRFGVIDAGGKFITPNELIALLTDYLCETRPDPRGVARSVATTMMVDRVAKARGIELYETPVGFKFIGELINEDKIVLGGEESAGLSIRGHYPEKDGILACLLAAEAVAARGTSLTEQLNELYRKVGKLESGRIGVKLTLDVADKLKDKLAQEPGDIAGRTVEKIDRIDGVKFLFGNDTWMLMRPSGTEPLVRIYAEAEDKKTVDELLEDGRKYLLG
jgi:phosphoglucomutase